MSDALPIAEIFSSIQGEGYLAGRRQIFIRLTRCNLQCDYCDTGFGEGESCLVENAPGSNSFEHLPRALGLGRLVDILKEWTGALPRAHHSISLTGGEPLLFAAVLREWLPLLRPILPVHLETNGTLPTDLARIVDQLDYVSMDMKLPSTAGCGGELWDAHRRFLEAAQGKEVSVKIVVGERTDLAEIEQVCRIIDSIRPDIPLFLQPLSLPDNHCGIAAAHLLHLQALASALLPDVRVIPQMHKLMGVL